MSSSSNMRLVRDWEAIRDKIKRYDWAAAIHDQTKKETDWWVANYADDVSRTSGWMHNYFCDKCFAHLIFDKTKPTEHVCSQCGSQRLTDEVIEAWNCSYRGASCTQVFHAAVMYRIHGDPAYMTYIRKVLNFLADNLNDFTNRGPAGFEGRFNGINLSDAVDICSILNGMEIVREEFTEDELIKYKTLFFMPMAHFMNVTPGGTPNIACWMKSALGMTGLFFGEHELCRLAAEGFEGFREVMFTGLLPSGFWYESSFHYHYYCAAGLTYYAAFCAVYDYDFPEFTDAIRKMYRYAIDYVFPNGLLPSPNDGWPLRTFANYAHQYEWIQNAFDEPAYRFALSECYVPLENGAKATHEAHPPLGGVPRLLFGTDWVAERERYELAHGVSIAPRLESCMDEHIHYVMLQNVQASVFLKYGYVIREHSHADIMNFELYANGRLLSRDISNSGYGSDLFKEWQRKAIAHNTVMVDRENQPNRPAGKMVAFDAYGNSCSVEAADVYPGVNYARSLQLLDDRLVDQFAITQTDDSRERTFDWLFHCSGEIESNLPFAPAEQPGNADGYQLMQDMQSCQVDGNFEISWVLPDHKLTLAMKGEPGSTVYIFRGFEHRSDLLRWGVMVRRTGTSAVYEAAYHFAD